MKRSIVLAFVTPCLLALIGLPALAQRPSISQLDAEVSELEAENDAQQAEIDQLRAASLRVFDATGAELGLLVDWEATSNSALVYLRGIGAYTKIRTDSGLLEDGNNNTLYFVGAGCTGQSYLAVEIGMAASRLVSPVIGVTERFFVGGNQYVGIIPVQSFAHFGARAPANCQNGPTSTPLNAVSAEELSIGDIGLPLPLDPPIYMAPALISGTAPPTLGNGDVDGDGSTNIADVSILRRALAGLAVE